MIKTMLIIVLVMVPRGTYEAPTSDMYKMLLPEVDLELGFTKFVDKVVKDIVVVAQQKLYIAPVSSKQCTVVMEGSVMSTMDCNLPSFCGKLEVTQTSTGWFSDRKVCRGYGQCEMDGQKNCNNMVKVYKLSLMSSFTNADCGNATCSVYQDTVGKFVLGVDVITQKRYIFPTGCLDYLYWSYDERPKTALWTPRKNVDQSTGDKYCLYDTSNYCRFLGPFENDQQAFRSLPITTVVKFDAPTELNDRHVHISDMYYDDTNTLALSARDVPYKLTATPSIIPLECMHAKYVSFSVGAIFEKQLHHVADRKSVV